MVRRFIPFFAMILVLALSISVLGAEEKKGAGDDMGPVKKSGPGFTVGFRAHWSWWDPVWSKTAAPIMPIWNWWIAGSTLNMPTTSSYLLNPYISVKINPRWSISGSYFYGTYCFTGWQLTGELRYNNSRNFIEHISNVKKHDADVLVSFALTSWMKLIAGVKYQGYIIKEETRIFVAGSSWLYMPMGDNTRFHSAGLGLGTSFTIPIVGSFYSLVSVAGLVMRGRDFASNIGGMNRLLNVLVSGIDKGGNSIFTIYGVNGTLSFLYAFKTTGLGIEAGSRIQYLRYTKTPRIANRQKYDLFYGPYLGVVYSYR